MPRKKALENMTEAELLERNAELGLEREAIIVEQQKIADELDRRALELEQAKERARGESTQVAHTAPVPDESGVS